MKYMGSKNRLAKYLLPIILKDRGLRQYYVEPFVGGANLIDKVHGRRLGSDINPFLIACLEMLQSDLSKLPKSKKETDEYTYKEMKEKSKLPIEQITKDELAIIGYYGFALSYGGKWFGGWRRDKIGKRDYVEEAYKNAVRQSTTLKNIVFETMDYVTCEIPNNSIIYCDPPYRGTTSYKNNFDHNLFWDWCRKQRIKGNIIFISEYFAPSDFKCVWEKEIVSSLTKETGSKTGIEKLFTLK